jgi:hypothetical protein
VAWPEDPALAPILVLASGQRCGSTLVQRLLTSHPEIMIWGEHGGHLRRLFEMVDIMRAWDEGVAPPAREAFASGAHQSWMANVLPGRDAIDNAARAFMRAFLGDPAAALGRPRWGFKEVRFGYEDAAALRTVFPELRVVHVTRDPRKMLISLDWWEQQRGWWGRDFTKIAVSDWEGVNRSFIDAAEGRESWWISWRYEDLTARPDEFVAAVAALVGADAGDFDASVFERRVSDYTNSGDRRLRQWRDLPPDLRGLLDDDAVQAVARHHGYELD